MNTEIVPTLLLLIIILLTKDDTLYVISKSFIT